MTLANKLNVGLCLLVVIMVLIGYYSWREVRSLEEHYVDFTELSMATEELVDELETDLSENMLHLLAFLQTGSGESIEEVFHEMEEISESLVEIELQDPDAELSHIVDQIEQVVERMSELIHGIIEGSANKQAQLEELLALYEEVDNKLIDQMLQQVVTKRQARAEEQLASTVQQLPRTIIACLVLAIGIAFLTRYSITKNISQNLERLRQAMSNFASGDRSRRAEIQNQDEIGALAKSFNQMADQLEATTVKRVELESINQNLEQEIQQHRQTQASLETAMHRAESSSRAKSEFLAVMSHELRTPMTPILALSDSLLDEDDPTIARERLKVLRGATDQLLDLINDILDYSKIEAGSMSLLPEATNLCDLFETVVQTHESQATSRNLKLHYQGDDESPILMLDPGRLRQIIDNLLNNAIKFTLEGSVWLSWQTRKMAEQRYELTVEVRDSGIGIAKEQQESIFEPFVQSDGSSTRRFGGSGLGLAICQRLSKLMQGSLSLESKLGEGSTFHFRLPCMSADFQKQAFNDAQGKQENLPTLPRGLAILHVDDDQLSHLAIELLLNRLRLLSEKASNQEDCLAALEKKPYDLVLLDIHLGGVHGSEVAKAIRERAPKDQQPRIIAVTADATEDTQQKCRQAGIQHYITKPTNAKQLAKVIQKALDAPV